MVKLIYQGPGHLLRVAGQEIPRGCEAELPAELVARLVADPAYEVVVVEGKVVRPALQPPPKTGIGSGRAAWYAHAVALGVPAENWTTRDEIIAAVEEATGEPNEIAEGGFSRGSN